MVCNKKKKILPPPPPLPPSSASQRKVPLISTSYNWDSLDAGGIFMIFGNEILLNRVRLGEAILYLY